MSRLGPWTPATHEERLERVEAVLEIGQLPPRYALALDARDLDAMVELFVPDVRVGGSAVGREALRSWFDSSLRAVRTTVHVVANHTIDLEGPDRAHGIVYCRDEVEVPERGEWQVGAIQYWDDYRRVGGTWFFERRRFHRWYQVDALVRPGPGAGVGAGDDPITTRPLPRSFPTWQPFWDRDPAARPVDPPGEHIDPAGGVVP